MASACSNLITEQPNNSLTTRFTGKAGQDDGDNEIVISTNHRIAISWRPDAGVYPVVEDDEAEQWQEAGHHQPGPVDVVPEGANWRFLTRVFPSVLNGRILFLCDVRIRI